MVRYTLKAEEKYRIVVLKGTKWGERVSKWDKVGINKGDWIKVVKEEV